MSVAKTERQERRKEAKLARAKPKEGRSNQHHRPQKVKAMVLFSLIVFFVFALIHPVESAKPAFLPSRSIIINRNDANSESTISKKMSATFKPCELTADPSTLPGDPSLILTTNVDLGDKKLEIMKACSKALAAATGKPESYIAVCITDNASMIFGGSDDPLALGCMYSIGAIAMESNGQIQKSVSDLLEPFGVTTDRIYINFFDMPRSDVGWNGRTFAG